LRGIERDVRYLLDQVLDLGLLHTLLLSNCHCEAALVLSSHNGLVAITIEIHGEI
jgi:hypothetical protein